jgi:class 3 adenylate cyclase
MSASGTQRRLAAILAADVVGYSRLMGQDEAGTLVALKSLRIEPLIQKSGSMVGAGCKCMRYQEATCIIVWLFSRF